MERMQLAISLIPAGVYVVVQIVISRKQRQEKRVASEVEEPATEVSEMVAWVWV